MFSFDVYGINTGLWTLIVVVPLTYVIYTAFINYRRFRFRAKCVDRFPGPPRHWLLGHLNLIPGPTEECLTIIRQMCSAPEAEEGVAQFWYGPFQPAVSLFNPSSVKTILKTSEPKPRGLGGYFMIAPWLGDGLLLSAGKKWSRNRRLLTPAFHFDILRPYMEVNNQCTKIFMDKIQSFADREECFEVFTHVSLLTLDIILRCAFSYDNDCQLRSSHHPYVNAVNSLQMTAVYRGLNPFLYPDFIFYLTRQGREFKRNCKYVHGISEEIIQKRKQSLLQEHVANQNKHRRYLDFVDILLTAKDDTGQGLTDREIRDEVDTFLFEGHDTTASGISWTLYSLAAHPEHQRRCQEEVDEILANRENQDIEWDDLPKLKFLTMCLKEALRMHTPVPFIQRQTTQDMTIEGRFVPAGTLIDIHLYMLHHNPRVWDDPEEFRPERFNEANNQDSVGFSFIPFSAGPRNCIGQHFAMHEMKTAISQILRRFTLSLDPNRPVKHQVFAVMKTEDGMYMKATPRHQAASTITTTTTTTKTTL